MMKFVGQTNSCKDFFEAEDILRTLHSNARGLLAVLSISFQLVSLSKGFPSELTSALSSVTVPNFQNISKPLANASAIHPERSDEPNRVTNGVPAQVGDFPFIVSLQSTVDNEHFCGGSLLHPSKVLTACHCLTVDNDQQDGDILMKPSEVMVHAGSILIDPSTGRRQVATHLFIDPRCLHNSPYFCKYDYDFGIVITEFAFITIPGVLEPLGKLRISSSLGEEFTQERTECSSAGWGYTVDDEEYDTSSQNLLKVQLNLIPFSKCRQLIAEVGGLYASARLRKHIHLCTLGEFGRDTCYGDSGGPLIYKNLLIGVVAYGYGCGIKDAPGVFARVDASLDWILNVGGTATITLTSYCLLIGSPIFLEIVTFAQIQLQLLQ